MSHKMLFVCSFDNFSRGCYSYITSNFFSCFCYVSGLKACLFTCVENYGNFISLIFILIIHEMRWVIGTWKNLNLFFYCLQCFWSCWCMRRIQKHDAFGNFTLLRILFTTGMKCKVACFGSFCQQHKINFVKEFISKWNELFLLGECQVVECR